jgi:hypothetical protein
VKSATCFALALLALLALSACSGGDDDGEAGSGGMAGGDDAQVGEEHSGGSGGAGSGGSGGDGSVGQDDAAAGSGGSSEDDADVDEMSSDDDSGTTGSSCTPIGEINHPHDSEAAPHIAEPLPASSYNSSPPSSGSHCNTWGHYATYGATRPLPACNFLHNLEHGAIVLLYNCPEGCPEVVETLEGIIAAPPDDPDCIAPRLVLTPYEEMDAKVAAAAWGYTWTSDCIDDAARESLVDFIEAHIGTRGDSPEATICGNGGFAPN